MNTDLASYEPNWRGIESPPARLPSEQGAGVTFPPSSFEMVDNDPGGKSSGLSDEAPAQSGVPLSVYCFYKAADWPEPRACTVSLMAMSLPSEIET